MTEHRSSPDQLMARALGICWHSPTSDRWPCKATVEPTAAPITVGGPENTTVWCVICESFYATVHEPRCVVCRDEIAREAS